MPSSSPAADPAGSGSPCWRRSRFPRSVSAWEPGVQRGAAERARGSSVRDAKTGEGSPRGGELRAPGRAGVQPLP